MVKRTILAILLAAPLFAFAQNIKLGKVDQKALFDAMPEKVAAEAQIKNLSSVYGTIKDEILPALRHRLRGKRRLCNRGGRHSSDALHRNIPSSGPRRCS